MFFLWVVFLFFLPGAGYAVDPIIVSLRDNFIESAALAAVPSSFMLENCSFDADIAVDIKEMVHLFPFTQGMTISREDLVHFLELLSYKHKFESVLITVSLDNNTGSYSLNFFLKGMWTVSKVSVGGVLRGRGRYRSLYTGSVGSFFDRDNHNYGLSKIREALRNEGYITAQVQDKLSFNENTKNVAVTICIDMGPRFHIKEVEISVKAEDLCMQECEMMRKKIMKRMPQALIGSSYTKEIINDETRRLQHYLTRKGFLQSHITLEEFFDYKKGLVKLQFGVTLKQKKRFEFFGNRFFSCEALLQQMMSFGSSLYLIPATLLAEHLTEEYKREGFWDIKIEACEEPQRIIFRIYEGERVKVPSVIFEGVTLFTDEHIKKFFLNQFYHKKFFNGESLKSGIDALLQAYIQQGYWHCTVGKKEYKKNESGESSVIVPIAEGARSCLAGIDIPHFEYLLNKEPFVSYVNLKDPIPFALSIIQDQRNYLVRYFHAKGYLYVQVRPEFIPEGEAVRLVWHIANVETPVRFGKTIISGAGKIPYLLFERESLYKEGDVWNPVLIEQTLRRLKDMDIFERISMYPESQEPHDKNLPIKHVVVHYVEDDPYEIRTRLGFEGVSRNLEFTGGATYKAGGTLIWKNITQHADNIRLDGDFSGYMQNIVAQYQFPWLLQHPIKTQLKVYSSRYDQPIVIGSRNILYRSVQDGFLIGLNRLLGGAQLGFNIGVDWMEITRLSPCLARTINFDPRLVNQRVPYLVAESTIFYDRLDNKVQPTYGALSVISFKGMWAMGRSDMSFIKILGEQAFYFPIIRSLVGAVRLRVGAIFHQTLNRIMPIERFYLGGGYSLRGYEPDLAPPLNVFTDCKGILRYAPIGGKSMANMNFELRFPLYGSLGGVIFTDMGVLSDAIIMRIHSGNLVGASGFGLRWYTPVGPLRFDIGWKWKPLPSGPCFPCSRSFAWFLTFGNAF